jgi:hypothetical protein
MPPKDKKTGLAQQETTPPPLQLLSNPSPPYPLPQPKHFPNPTVLRPRRRVELVSSGVDEALQGLAGDPYGGSSWLGLRVPALVTTGPHGRYLFQLCSFEIPEAINAWVRGFRQGWTLGQRIAGGSTQEPTTRVVEQWVTDPNFKLPDGNISWHMRMMGPNEPPIVAPGTIPDPAFGPPNRNLAFETSQGPALLFQDPTTVPPGGFYAALTAYTPPNAGMPYGRALTGELGTFYDLKTDWRDPHAWHALDIHIEGPARVAFFCSVQQSDPATRTALTVPVSPLTFYDGGLSAEEQFLLNFDEAIIWRVAGGLVVEIDDQEE